MTEAPDAAAGAHEDPLVAMLLGGLPQPVEGGWACVHCEQIRSTQERALGCSCGGGALRVIPAAMAVVGLVSGGQQVLRDGVLALDEAWTRVSGLLDDVARRERELAERAARLEASTTQVETVQDVAVPAVQVVALGQATVDVQVTWPSPFPDAAYTVWAPAVSVPLALGGRARAQLVPGSATRTGALLRVTTTATLAAGTATLAALAVRRGGIEGSPP